MSRTLILGAGFGGVTVATELRRRMGDAHEIVLVDRAEHFAMGLRKLWQLVGIGTIEQGQRSRCLLRERGIQFVQSEILELVPEERRVVTADASFDGDHLVVALGAQPRPDLVAGLVEHGHDLWTATAVPALQQALTEIETSGEPSRLVIAITGVPYTCPPAPFECAMLLDDWLRERGVREKIELEVTTLQPILLPNAGKDGSDWLAEQLRARQIAFQTGCKVTAVEAGRLQFESGELAFDLLIGVPPHRVPPVVEESGLTGEGQWVQVDSGTLETSSPGVYAIGDVIQIKLENGMALPKAGLMAELQGTRVAAAIAAALSKGAAPEPFDGRGFCYLETGKRTAALIEGDFFASPKPVVELRPDSKSNAEAKHRFEAERLERWFS